MNEKQQRTFLYEIVGYSDEIIENQYKIVCYTYFVLGNRINGKQHILMNIFKLKRFAVTLQ